MLAVNPHEPPDDEESRDHEVLRTATGDVLLAPRTREPMEDEEDYMASWTPPLALSVRPVGAIDFSNRVVAGSPEGYEDAAPRVFRAGPWELATVTAREDASEVAVLLRSKSRVKDVTWEALGRAHDDRFVVIDAHARWDDVDWPADREALDPAFEFTTTILHERTADDGAFVWIQNQSGNGLKAFAAVDENGAIAALLLQLF